MRRDIPTGYSSIVRTLVDGKASDDLYYDPEMRPVRCSSGYYGLHREYDADGQNKYKSPKIGKKLYQEYTAGVIKTERDF